MLLESDIYLTHDKNVLKIVETLAHQYTDQGRDEAFTVLDVDDVVRKVEWWHKLLPRVDLFYAVKCNPHRDLLQILAVLGVGFDCASKSELDDILSLGVNPSRIIYANPCKALSHIKHAQNINVSLMTFDNEYELHKIKENFPSAELVLRIRSDAKTAKHKLGSKFGASVDEARSLLAVAWTLQVRVVGVSFHVGSGCTEPYAYTRAIAAARKVFNEALKVGFRLHLLDIGGGFTGQDESLMEDHSCHVNTALDKFFPDDGSVRIIGEPGKYVVRSAFTVASCIVGRKDHFDTDNQLIDVMYYSSESIYSSFLSEAHFDGTTIPQVLQVKEGAVEVPSQVWGHTCCSLDLLIKRVLLPELHLGDWLVWENMGAYTSCLWSNFNGFHRPETYITASHSTWNYIEGCMRDWKREVLPENGTKSTCDGRERLAERTKP